MRLAKRSSTQLRRRNDVISYGIMITNFYTLRALVEEWQDRVVDHVLVDVFSQEPDELTIAIASESRESMIRVGTRAPFRFVFRSDGYSRARRNVATLFEPAIDSFATHLSIAHRDRVIFLRLDSGLSIQFFLFGPRANVLLVSDDGVIADAFQDGTELSGSEPPEPRPAPAIDSFEEFEGRWRSNRKSVAHALAAACPLFDRDIATEVAFRADVDAEGAPDVNRTDLRSLFHAAKGIEEQLRSPTPKIYWDDDDPVLFSLVKLSHATAYVEEDFDSVDAAVRVYVRRSLARRKFRELYDPVKRALSDAVEHYRGSAERMLDELSQESRADRYEKWGHLLMASPHEVPAGAKEVALPDLFSEAETVVIPLDPALSAVDNARKYYDRARRTRRSREEAEKRLIDTERTAKQAAALLDELRSATGVREVQDFRKTHAAELARFMPDEEAPGDRLPFRRFALPDGYEVWVGRNAKQNDDLTFHHAQKHDLWMHARGVPGSHAVLRKPNRNAEPGKFILQTAASIAAHFSKARGSSLVPVIVTERKYVTKPKGAPPGAVRVDREDVHLVEPRLPP